MTTEIFAGDASTPVWAHHFYQATSDLTPANGGMDPMAFAAITADETEPRYTRIHDVDVLILRGINLNDDRRLEDMVSLRLAITAHWVESVALQRVRAVDDIATRVAGRVVTSSEIVAGLVERLTTRVKEAVLDLNRRMADMEDRIEAPGPNPPARDLAELRRQAIWLLRFSAPQAEALEQLLDAGPVWLDDAGTIVLREQWHATRRNVSALEALRDHSRLLQDRIDQAVAEANQRTAYLLTIIAGIFLPLNLVAAFLGANVGGLPWSDNSDGFLYLCILSGALTAVEVVLLRMMRWL